MAETYREYISRRFRAGRKPRSLDEAASMLKEFASEWKGRKGTPRRSEENMAGNENPVSRKPPYAQLRTRVTQTATDAFTQATIQTPVNPQGLIGMRIHAVQFEIDQPDMHATALADLVAALYSNSRTSMPDIDLSGAIAKAYLQMAPLDLAPVGMVGSHLPARWEFGEQGIIYTAQQIFFAIDGVNNSQAHDADVIIYYTLEKLQQHEFLAAFSTLQGAA